MKALKHVLLLLAVAAALIGCRSGGSQSTAQGPEGSASDAEQVAKPVIFRPQPGTRGC